MESLSSYYIYYYWKDAKKRTLWFVVTSEDSNEVPVESISMQPWCTTFEEATRIPNAFSRNPTAWIDRWLARWDVESPWPVSFDASLHSTSLRYRLWVDTNNEAHNDTRDHTLLFRQLEVSSIAFRERSTRQQQRLCTDLGGRGFWMAFLNWLSPGRVDHNRVGADCNTPKAKDKASWLEGTWCRRDRKDSRIANCRICCRN